MTPTPMIYQACTWPPPKGLVQCIEHAELYSIENNFEYKRDDLDRANFKYLSSASDRQRVQMLAERPYTLWVDWDLLLLDAFELPENLDQPMRAADFLIWNGANTETFADALYTFDTYHKEFPSGYNEHYRMWKCLRQAGFQEISEFNSTTYNHLNWSKFGIAISAAEIGTTRS